MPRRSRSRRRITRLRRNAFSAALSRVRSTRRKKTLRSRVAGVSRSLKRTQRTVRRMKPRLNHFSVWASTIALRNGAGSSNKLVGNAAIRAATGILTPPDALEESLWDGLVSTPTTFGIPLNLMGIYSPEDQPQYYAPVDIHSLTVDLDIRWPALPTPADGVSFNQTSLYTPRGMHWSIIASEKPITYQGTLESTIYPYVLFNEDSLNHRYGGLDHLYCLEATGLFHTASISTGAVTTFQNSAAPGGSLESSDEAIVRQRARCRDWLYPRARGKTDYLAAGVAERPKFRTLAKGTVFCKERWAPYSNVSNNGWAGAVLPPVAGGAWAGATLPIAGPTTTIQRYFSSGSSTHRKINVKFRKPFKTRFMPEFSEGAWSSSPDPFPAKGCLSLVLWSNCEQAVAPVIVFNDRYTWTQVAPPQFKQFQGPWPTGRPPHP